MIVRSSAKGEDSLEKSLAGSYLSVQNVKSDIQKEVKNAVNQVINSYSKNYNYFKENQILIQKQTKNVEMSGVIFTTTPESGTPYYVINYEIGNSTDGVTQGKVSTSIKIFKETSTKKISKKIKIILEGVKELENIFPKKFLDIEFAINSKNKLKIFL